MVLNERLQRRLKLIVMVASAIVFVAVAVLGFQIAIRMSQSRQEARLQAQNDELRRQIAEVERETDWLLSDDFVTDYALHHLGFGRPGSQWFTRPPG